MKIFRSSLAVAAFAAVLASLLSTAAPAHAQTLSEAEIHERLLADRAACERNRTGDALQNCLREAGAAAQAARQGKLSDDDEERFRQNALARCTPLPPEQREACRMRIQGEGTVRGSVQAGGIFRELRIIEPAPQPTASPVPSPTPTAPAAPPATAPSTTPPSTTSATTGAPGRPTFTPVQPVVPGRAVPAPAPAPAPATATPPPASLQVSPPSTPVLQVPVAPAAGTVQPSAPQPLLVVPGNVPPESAR